MKVVICGTGKYYQMFKWAFEKDYIVALLDNSKEKQGQIIDGKRVLSCENIQRLDYDAIFIMSIHFYSEIVNSLIQLDVDIKNIYSVYRIYEKLQNKIPQMNYNYIKCRNVKFERKDKRILIATHNFDYNGAVIALYHVVLVLLKKDYQITVISGSDGDYRKFYEKLNCDIIINPSILVLPLDKWNLPNQYNHIILNGINFITALNEYNCQNKIMLWLHSPGSAYEGMDEYLFSKVDFENVDVYAVGDLAAKAFRKICKTKEVAIMPYGIKDFFVSNDLCLQHEKVIIAIIGRVCELKGQDILIDALSKIESSIKKHIEVWIIGELNDSLGLKLKNKVANDPDLEMVSFLNQLDRDKIKKIYKDIDILISSSREDVLPIVVAEAMMNKKVCILSNNIGTIKYVRDGIDAYVYDGTAYGLANVLTYVLCNQNRWEQVGENARKIYENVFSLRILEHEIDKFLEDNLSN